jgi:transposase-like protein
MSESKPLPKQVFTEECKCDVIRLAIERGNVCATVRDIGIHETV